MRETMPASMMNITFGRNDDARFGRNISNEDLANPTGLGITSFEMFECREKQREVGFTGNCRRIGEGS
jgi:hypothetical protein